MSNARSSERIEDDSARNDPGNASRACAELREVQIAELRERYRRGLYKVDAAKVSAKMIDERLDK